MSRKAARLPELADWIVENELAAMPLPSEDELRQLEQCGFGLVVNLTERPGPTRVAAKVGLRAAHLPIADLTAPTLDEVVQFVGLAEGSVAAGAPVAVHCLGGRGRTGTMAACYLVRGGLQPWGAIDEVRRCRPGSIETSDQERAVLRYAQYLAKRRQRRPSVSRPPR